MFDSYTQQLLQQQRRQKEPKPLDSYPVPRHLLEEFFRRADYVANDPTDEQIREAVEGFNSIPLNFDKDYRRHEMVTWLYEVMPIIRGQRVKAVIEDPLNPRVDAYGPLTDIPDEPGIARVLLIPAEYQEELMRLALNKRYNVGRLQMTNHWRLWSRLAEIQPECQDGSWSLGYHNGGMVIVKRVDDQRREQEERDRFAQQLGEI